MNRVIIALAVGVSTAGPALASDKGDIMAILNQWNDADEAKAVAACADDAAVIDDIPPYEWHGSSACSKWQKDYDAYLQLLITRDRAYAVIPATFAFTKDGKPVRISATATFALHKTAAGWRITGWAWANKS